MQRVSPEVALTLVVFAGAAVAFGALAYVISGVGADTHAAYRRRLKRLGGLAPGVPPELMAARPKRRRTGVDGGLTGDIQKKLARAGLAISPMAYMLLSLLVGGVGGGVVQTVVNIPLAASVAGLAAMVFVPRVVLAILISRRETRFLRQFPDAIDLIIRGVKSGYPVAEAIGLIADELPDPIGGEFRIVIERLRLGQSMEQALSEAAERIGLPDVRFFAVSLSVQHETGGNISETLQNLSDILRKRQHMKLKIKALSSEARASAWIIGSLPFIVMLLMYFLNPGYLDGLIADPTGRVLLGFALLSELIGVAVMVRMTKFKI